LIAYAARVGAEGPDARGALGDVAVAIAAFVGAIAVLDVLIDDEPNIQRFLPPPTKAVAQDCHLTGPRYDQLLHYLAAH
jgi:hypothetical protein